VWIDFLSIPQLVDVNNEDVEVLRQHELDQTSAVPSIPYCVERCNFFWVLAPDAVHEDRQEPCGFADLRSGRIS